ncbi:alpha/beta hydrolase [Dyella sp. LX-66]|nr:alpha/beta hydrolase [Dyella sp. LX-1]MBT2140082.1 alpha/beta hydrolase [Dyella sp. LX-66]
MTAQTMETRELRLMTRYGQVYARQWRPASADAASEAPIVLLHDSLGCVLLWRDFPERLALATSRTVVAYDRVGFGWSAPHPGKLERNFIREEARDTFQCVREQLDIDRFVALGHSVGGGMAVGCAAEHAQACEAIVTLAAQAFVEDRTVEGILKAKAAFQLPGQRERLARYHGDKVDWILSAWIDTWLDSAFSSWTLDDDLRQVRCPALVMHGSADEYGSAHHPQRIAASINGPATLEILQGCGHVPHRDRPEVVLSLIRQQLARPLSP